MKPLVGGEVFLLLLLISLTLHGLNLHLLSQFSLQSVLLLTSPSNSPVLHSYCLPLCLVLPLLLSLHLLLPLFPLHFFLLLYLFTFTQRCYTALFWIYASCYRFISFPLLNILYLLVNFLTVLTGHLVHIVIPCNFPGVTFPIPTSPPLLPSARPPKLLKILQHTSTNCTTQTNLIFLYGLHKLWINILKVDNVPLTQKTYASPKDYKTPFRCTSTFATCCLSFYISLWRIKLEFILSWTNVSNFLLRCHDTKFTFVKHFFYLTCFPILLQKCLLTSVLYYTQKYHTNYTQKGSTGHTTHLNKKKIFKCQ